MAIRKKIRASGELSYLVYWVNPYTGRQTSKNFHDLKEAKAYDSLVKHKIKHDNEEFKPKEYVRSGNDLTIEDAMFLYLREKQFTERNTGKFISSLEKTIDYCGNIKISEFIKEDFNSLKLFIEQQISKKTKKKYSQAYVANQLTNLRTVIIWAVDKGFIKMAPTMKIGAKIYNKTIPPTIEEVQRLLEYAPPHLFRVIILGVSFGLRVGESELLSLTWDKINIESGYILIDTSKKNAQQPWRQIPIRDDVMPILIQWKKDDEDQGIRHLVHFKGKPVSTIKRSWKTACKHAGIERKIRPYDLRHTFATQLIKEGVDVGTVANLMGHSSPQMIFKHYQHVMTEQKKKAVESMPKIKFMSFMTRRYDQ